MRMHYINSFNIKTKTLQPLTKALRYK